MQSDWLKADIGRLAADDLAAAHRRYPDDFDIFTALYRKTGPLTIVGSSKMMARLIEDEEASKGLLKQASLSLRLGEARALSRLNVLPTEQQRWMLSTDYMNIE